MHYVALVLGPDPAGQLAPYNENREVEPYLTDCWCEDGCSDCNGTQKYETTRNPDGRWDWFCIGGRWRGLLFLKDGAHGELGEASWGSEPEDFSGRADVCFAGDVDWEKTAAHWSAKRGRDKFSTYALVAEGVMRERSEWDGNNFVDFPNWDDFFARMVLNAPPDTPLTVVDYHS